jgi:hypothetical protein
MSEMTNKAMRICENKGFHLDLPNGVTASVQFGPGNYVDGDVKLAEVGAPKGKDVWGSNTAECGAYLSSSFHGHGDGLKWVSVPGFTGDGGDDVAGWLDVQEVLDFINQASQLVDPKAN